MAGGPTFLATAKSRLLPASVPFRFFGAAAVFHVIAWLALIAGADDATAFRGGLGWPLAALHAVTLGVLAMTAMGASLQLLPVATRQPVASRRLPVLLWWLHAPGVGVIVAAMALRQPAWLAAGAVPVGLALAIYAGLLARNLAGARGMPVVVAHGWAAWASLVALLASAAALALAYLGVPTIALPAAVGLHIAFAAYGFMGLLVLGLSQVLVPMFVLSPSPEPRPALVALALAVLGLALWAAGAFGLARDILPPAAIITGLAALAIHLGQMRTALRTGMRRGVGGPFLLVRAGWAGLVASLCAALALQSDAIREQLPRAPTLFGVLAIGALLSVLLGMLARIVPFLASMHAPPGRRGALLPSALTAEGPLGVAIRAHLLALGLLLAAVAVDSAWLVRAAGAAGAVGGIAYARFLAFAWRRMHGAPIAGADRDLP